MKIKKVLKRIFRRESKKSFGSTRNLKEINYEELHKLIKSHSNIKLVDVRSPQ